MSQFGQQYLQPFELLSIGIGNASDLTIEQSIKFCLLFGLEQCNNLNLEEIHKKINKYLLSLDANDFILNFSKLQHNKELIMDVLNSNLKAQTIELQDFQKVLDDIKIYVNNIKNPSKETQIVIRDILSSLK